MGERKTGTEKNEAQLRQLIDIGLLLASERSLDVIVQGALDAGLKLCGAAFGAFFYNQTTPGGERYKLYKVSGTEVDLQSFAKLPMPRNTDLFAPVFEGRAIVRSDDILQDSRYGKNAPYKGMPAGHLPVRSYLSVPVRSRGGEVLGALFYGHPEPNRFEPGSEDLVAIMASQAAVAIENTRLTEKLQHEMQLLENARQLQRITMQRLQQALQAGQLGIWTWNREDDTAELDERAAEFYGVQPNVRLPRTEVYRDAVYGEDAASIPDDMMQRLAPGKDSYSVEFRVVKPGQGIRWLLAHGLALYGPDGKEVVGLSGTVQDITARKTQEATLRQSEKLAATGRLAATIAHEINNPLEAVTNLIYLCKTDPVVPPAIQKLLETADSELARVSQIAQQTLGFYRETALPGQVNLNKVIRDVVELFSRKLTSKKMTSDVSLEDELKVIGLQGEIKQVFSNLLVNAVDASATGTAIRIRGHKTIQQGVPGVSLLIVDQGAGIPKEVRVRLFSPFFTTKQAVGTGLGLWVTRGIVEKHGGTVSFRTQTGKRSGTVFRVFLPEAGAEQALQMRPQAQILQ
ncbi:MAG: ATP-binding protein [Acidobacteriaceae bacterium]|nr:ATP-binding protein [Acidobacteriaceae bacterium]